MVQVGSTSVRVRFVPNRFVAFASSEHSFHGIVGASESMRGLFALVDELAKTDLPVLIVGETGTGKELVARALHKAGLRRDRPFLVFDCGAALRDLVRSEVFGHEKGAFTGAFEAKKGILEAAAGGTVFFDEIGEMDLSLQPNLLRSLEAREISRIGSHRAIPVDFRIVAATNRDLDRLMTDGRFREDLYFRLACVTIRLPALRDRKDDLPILAEWFLDRCAERLSEPRPKLTEDALALLVGHGWPGNIRQLRNVLEVLCLKAKGNPILSSHVNEVLASQTGAAVPAREGQRQPATLEEAEKAVLLATLLSTGWNRKVTAKRLGISPTTLVAKIRRYSLSPPGRPS
jgi:DNA-binding NtrC family response regulator